MFLLLIGIGIILFSGIVSCTIRRNPLRSSSIGATGSVLGAILGIVPAVNSIISGQSTSLRCNWSMPYGSFIIEIDPLSAIFLIPIFVLSALSAVYGVSYLNSHKGNPTGVASFFFNLLTCCMIFVVIARNGLLFLIVWEIMSLASFFLVSFDDEHPESRQAGFIYLIAMHIGTAFLIALFAFLGKETGSLDFDTFTALRFLDPATASMLFFFALIGFGAKAGLVPLHVWLPEAHPAAPSHVSALMSGVMIKTGIYGILRTLTFLPELQAWWGWSLVIAGATSGILGVLFAIAQHDIKRLLAYHSVENIGIITLGIGIGILGINSNYPLIAIAGFSGALLHVINHAFFKGLLFLGAGAVFHATGTREIDKLGGLIKRMPWTAGAFLIGAIAICGIPPFNGFISEFMIYFGAFQGSISGIAGVLLPAVCTIASLALIGGLALACFTKSFGVIFLGESRSDYPLKAHEADTAMQLPMWILAACCILIGICAPQIIPVLAPVVVQVTKMQPAIISEHLYASSALLSQIIWAMVAMAAFVGIISGLRFCLLRNRKVEHQVTWDCGYARPSARMQYTGSSFAEPLVTLFHLVLRTHNKIALPKGAFPPAASYETHTPDAFHDYLFRPLFKWIDHRLEKLHWFQQGSIQIYILYIAGTLIALMIWKLW
jgi:formate hydrogenlyase subunit 3/multisubunit Na+/H+ antiporter MnhD subunit